MKKFLCLFTWIGLVVCLSACQVGCNNDEALTFLLSSSVAASNVLPAVEIAPSGTMSSLENTPLPEPTDDSRTPEPVDELTLVVLTPDGKPVPNIGVYAYPTQSGFLAGSASYAITNHEGFAILQRVRIGEELNENITVGLADRNQSDTIQQTTTVTMPDSASAYEPQAIVWNKMLPTDYLKEQTSKITLQIVNSENKALPNIWVKIGLKSRTAPDGSNIEMGYQEDLPYEDRYLMTGTDGTCTFSNVENGIYSIGLWSGAPPFNLVASDNPLLQSKLVYSDPSTWGATIDYTGGKQSFTLEFIPYIT